MATSTFFNNVGSGQEQILLEDLIIEAIQVYGIDMWYLPRTQNTINELYLQSDVSTFNRAFEIELYVKTYEGFEGEGNFMSKFGLEIRDQITFTMAKRVFDNFVGRHLGYIRPKEGDLIFYPLNRKAFEIKYVQNKPIHYPLGSLPTYDISCELYEYSNEHFDTGIPEIDIINQDFSTNIFDHSILTDEGEPLLTDTGFLLLRDQFDYDNIAAPEDNTELANTQVDSTIIDFSETDPYSENWEDHL